MAKGPLYGAVPIQSQIVQAAAAIPAYRATMRGAVNATTQGKTAQVTAASTSAFFGASNNPIAAVLGDDVQIIQLGQAIGTANAAVARGDYLTPDATGKLGPTVADKAQVVGVAEEAAAADGDFFSYTIRCFTLSI